MDDQHATETYNGETDGTKILQPSPPKENASPTREMIHHGLDFTDHDRIVRQLAAQVRGFAGRGEQFRMFHGSSNSTRPPSTGNVLDVSALNKIIFIQDQTTDCEGWCLVEPNVPMDKLVEATIQRCLVPPVVMEFPGITVGGGFSGTSAESSSFRHGYFSDNVIQVEMILGDGNVVKASGEAGDENRDLFHAAAGTMGTLGIVTMLKLRLVEAKNFVHVHYCRLDDNLRGAISEFSKKRTSANIDYLDGIIFSKQHTVAVTGTLVSEKCIPKDANIKSFSNASDDWYYRHVRRKTENISSGEQAEDYVPLAEYLFRYDRGGFWVGEMGYTYFRCIPFTSFMRWLLDDFSHTRTLYHALHATGVSRELIIQDVTVPWENSVELIDYIGDELDIWPLWLCPLRKAHPPTFHPVTASPPFSTSPDGGDMLSIGIWGWGPKQDDEFIAKNRGLEKKLEDLGGRKWLYAHTFYSEEEFWRVYDREWYEDLRNRYHANSLPSIYDKVKRDAGGVGRGWTQTMMEMWPVGGLYGMWLAIRSGDIGLHRYATWKWNSKDGNR